MTTAVSPASLPPAFQPPDVKTLTQSQGAAAISALISNTALVQALFPNPSLCPAAVTPATDPMATLLQSAFTYQLANSGNNAVLSTLLSQQPGQVVNATA